VTTVIVEIPTGSRNKYEMDHESGRIALKIIDEARTRLAEDYR
jgi:inorganic pyrophosphatase